MNNVANYFVNNQLNSQSDNRDHQDPCIMATSRSGASKTYKVTEPIIWLVHVLLVFTFQLAQVIHIRVHSLILEPVHLVM